MKTIHRCTECNHQSVDHSFQWTGGKPPMKGPCSYGGCVCRLTPTEVQERNPAVEIPTFPAYDTGSGVWMKRAGS